MSALDYMVLATVVLFGVAIVAIVSYRREYETANHWHTAWMQADTARDEADSRAWNAERELTRAKGMLQEANRQTERALAAAHEALRIANEQANDIQRLERVLDAKNRTLDRYAVKVG